MTEDKKDNPRPRAGTTAFADSEQIRQQPGQKAQEIKPPDPDSLTNEEIKQRYHEIVELLEGLPFKMRGCILDITERKQAEEKVSGLNHFFGSTMDSLSYHLAVLDQHGKILLVNRAWREFAQANGIPAQQVSEGADYLAVCSHASGENSEGAESFAEGIRAVISGVRDSYSREYPCHSPDKQRWFTGRVTPFAEYAPRRVVVWHEEITDRKQAEEALRQSENYYRTIFETSATAMFILEEDTTLSHVNSNFEKLLGYSKQEVEGKKYWTEFIHPDDVEWMKENHCLRRRDPLAAPLSYEFRFFVRNGELRHGYLTADIIPGTSRSVVSLIDINERKLSEQHLKESEERFAKAFRSSPAPQSISDITTGEFIDVNDRWVDMLGYAREQLIGRTSKELCIWADPGERDRIIQKLQENTFFNEEPVEFRTSKGSTVYALWSAERITLKGRHVMLSMISDETERKQAEKEQEKLQAQLVQAQKMESVGRLAGGVAHDFNNKLSIINGYAEMSLDMLDPEEPVYENLREIYSAGKRSADIVRQLLAFARQQTISPVRLDLNDTISNMLKMLQRLIGENIDLAWHPGSNLWQLKIDPSQIDQVMANLAVNARDAIEDVGKLIIETKNVVVDEDYCRQYSYFVPGRYVMLAVSDNGCGMEKQVQDNLFEPFFTTKEVGKGTGLGLSTIYGIVKQNKGFINVYSEPGQGTTVKIFLPPHEQQESGSSHHLKESEKQVPTGSETVMLVEDEPAILKMGKGMLEKLGYTVLSAERPDEALRLAEEHEGRIHLLITDVVMPEMNGRDLSIKLSDCSPGLKSIYMSGYTADVIAHHGVLDEGVHFIQKPFSIQDLAVKVREAIEQQ
ncbi:MAG: PAS domain S-box protein [Thermodesulfobacteriota bacterium]